MIKKIIQLPLFLKPLYETKLIRIGKDNDGGYLIAEAALKNTKILLSFGLSDDWSFDEDFFNRSKSRVFTFDPSVDWKFWIKKLFRNLKEIFLFQRKSFKEISEIFSYFKYKKFFNNNDKIHLQKLIVPRGTFKIGLKNEQMTDLNILMKNTTEKNTFLKIDIEGSEYRILDQIIEYQEYIVGLVIEFHNCDLHQDLIKDFIKKFQLQLVHIHINNFGMINKNNFPFSIEATFSPKEFNNEIKDNLKSYPLPLDQPCNPLYDDNSIEFFN